VAAIEGDGACEEAGRRDRFLVSEDLGVGEAAVVVDGDVDVLPAFVVLVASIVAAASNAMTRPDDATELLHIDVEQLARPRPLVPSWLLEP
jgi:hypothetical protein